MCSIVSAAILISILAYSCLLSMTAFLSFTVLFRQLGLWAAWGLVFLIWAPWGSFRIGFVGCFMAVISSIVIVVGYPCYWLIGGVDPLAAYYKSIL